MKEFIDKTTENSGTLINRKNLMAVQGFIASSININDDGSIVQLFPNGEKLETVFNSNGSITETFSGEKVITKTTTFNEDGSIMEVVIS